MIKKACAEERSLMKAIVQRLQALVSGAIMMAGWRVTRFGTDPQRAPAPFESLARA
jgi:hypothetical protein